MPIGHRAFPRQQAPVSPAKRGGPTPGTIITRPYRGRTLQLLVRVPDDIEAARAAFAADPSSENSERLTALIERTLQDGPVGGFG